MIVCRILRLIDLLAPRRHPLSAEAIKQLYNEAIGITGIPEKPKFLDKIIARIEYRNGTTIDVVRGLERPDE